jgi:hypothetical protein
MENLNREPAIKTTLMFKEMQVEINKININMAELQKDIAYIKVSTEKNDQAHKEIMEKIDSFKTEAGTFYYKKGTDISHRVDGPAREWSDGDKEWWINGQLHREDGPAVEYSNGTKQYWINGELHREDGPAFPALAGRGS